MKTKSLKALQVLIVCLICSLVSSVITYSCYKKDYEDLEARNNYKRDLICVYQQYYDFAEEILDTLAKESNWPDRLDVEMYYDAEHKLDSLYSLEE